MSSRHVESVIDWEEQSQNYADDSNNEDDSNDTSDSGGHLFSHISEQSALHVNCSRALRVDWVVCQSAFTEEPYPLDAPKNCRNCGSIQIRSSLNIWRDGSCSAL